MKTLVLSILCLLALAACDGSLRTTGADEIASSANVPVFDLTTSTTTTLAAARSRLPKLVLVHLKGEVRHFGYDLTSQPASYFDYRATVAGAKVWVSEYPLTKALNLRTNSVGAWELYVLKRASDTLPFSMVYEKDFFPSSIEAVVLGAPLAGGWELARGKANVIDVADRNIEDLGMQLPDELYLMYAKRVLEGQIKTAYGVDHSAENIVVVTVGKSWASLFSDSLPHGDPGAHTVISPALANPLQGPIYFNEHVFPDPTYTATSVDGGVLYNNLAPGAYSITAVKPGIEFETVRFQIEEGIRYYVASPPHSIQGSNNSLPGRN